MNREGMYAAKIYIAVAIAVELNDASAHAGVDQRKPRQEDCRRKLQNAGGPGIHRT
jgi:hypothetical protein